MHTCCCCCCFCVLCIFYLFRESLGYQDLKETRDGKVIGYAFFVTMWDIKVLKQRRRRWQRERQKSNRFRLAKQQACTSTTLFDYEVKIPSFTFCGGSERKATISFSFS